MVCSEQPTSSLSLESLLGQLFLSGAHCFWLGVLASLWLRLIFVGGAAPSTSYKEPLPICSQCLNPKKTRSYRLRISCLTLIWTSFFSMGFLSVLEGTLCFEVTRCVISCFLVTRSSWNLTKYNFKNIFLFRFCGVQGLGFRV